MSAIYIFIPLPSLPWGIDRAFRYIGFYAIGTVLASFKIDEKIRMIHISVKWIAIVALIIVDFLLSYMDFVTGVMWFATAMIGTVAALIMSITIDKNRILECLGRISLIVLCTHGPVYRILIKVISLPLRMSTDAVRGNLILALMVTTLTLFTCSVVYQIINRFFPWVIGKSVTAREK